MEQLYRISARDPSAMAMQPPFLVTVDIEPDWGLQGCRAAQETLPRLVERMRLHGVRATFFVVADMLEECGELFRRVLSPHEVASHGLTHRVLTGLASEDVQRELVESKRRLEAAFGRRVRGIRAPFLSTPPQWLESVAAAGYEYDASEGAVAPSPRNRRPAAWQAQRRNGVTVIPTVSLRTGWVPFSLTSLRLLAPLGERWVAPDAAVMYFHLHELADPGLMRVLPFPMRMLLRRGVGRRSWEILDRLLARVAPRAVTCSEMVDSVTRGA